MDSSFFLSTGNIIWREGVIVCGLKEPLEVSFAHGNKPLAICQMVIKLTAVIFC